MGSVHSRMTRQTHFFKWRFSRFGKELLILMMIPGNEHSYLLVVLHSLYHKITKHTNKA